jgi:predicted metal-dependent peptidase
MFHEFEKAAFNFIKTHPFFFGILSKLEKVETSEVDTMATDGQRLLINREFFLSLPEQERIFLIAHEISHVFLSHHFRLKDRDAKLANIAADYAVNLLLSEIGYQINSKYLFDFRFKNWSFEKIYNFLEKQQNQKQQNQKQQQDKSSQQDTSQQFENSDIPQNPIPGQSFIFSPQGSEQEIAEQKKQQDFDLNQLYQLGKLAGINNGKLNPYIEKRLKPKIDWQKALESYLTDLSTSDYSYRRPNIHYVPYSLYCPSLYSEKLGKIAIYQDTSGSFSLEQIQSGIEEIRSLCSTFAEEITLSFFTHEVYQTIENFNEYSKIESIQDGGTSFSACFEHAKKLEDISLVIIITDGYCSDAIDLSLDIPLLWIIDSTEFNACKYGEVIYLDSF